jgi:hypothetical protein
MVKEFKLVTMMEILPFFYPREMAKFRQISKDCNELMDPNSSKHRINYQVLFSQQGITLTLADIEETKISTTRAL